MRKEHYFSGKELFNDFGAFILALLPRTIARITGGVVSAALAIYCVFGHPVYPWLAWFFVALFLFSAAFSAWRDERHKNESKAKEKLFTQMVDLIKGDAAAGWPYRGTRFDSIGVLIQFSNEIQTEDELTWYCNKFSEHGYNQPFYDFETWAAELFQGKWLPVLREARHQQNEITNRSSFVSFLTHNWSRKKEYLNLKNKRVLETLDEMKKGSK
jgi:hypothetical protein